MSDNTAQARRTDDVPRPKWRLLVPIFVLLITAGALALLPRFKASSTGTTQVTASVTETDAGARTTDKSLPPAPSYGTHKEQRTTTLTLDMMKEREQYHTQRQQWMVQAGISLIMALAAVFIILSKKYPEDANKWAYSTIAFISGYWLK
jgi:hypothetical protein